MNESSKVKMMPSSSLLVGQAKFRQARKSRVRAEVEGRLVLFLSFFSNLLRSSFLGPGTGYKGHQTVIGHST